MNWWLIAALWCASGLLPIVGVLYAQWNSGTNVDVSDLAVCVLGTICGPVALVITMVYLITEGAGGRHTVIRGRQSR